MTTTTLPGHPGDLAPSDLAPSGDAIALSSRLLWVAEQIDYIGTDAIALLLTEAAEHALDTSREWEATRCEVLLHVEHAQDEVKRLRARYELAVRERDQARRSLSIQSTGRAGEPDEDAADQ